MKGVMLPAPRCVAPAHASPACPGPWAAPGGTSLRAGLINSELRAMFGLDISGAGGEPRRRRALHGRPALPPRCHTALPTLHRPHSGLAIYQLRTIRGLSGVIKVAQAPPRSRSVSGSDGGSESLLVQSGDDDSSATGDKGKRRQRGAVAACGGARPWPRWLCAVVQLLGFALAQAFQFCFWLLPILILLVRGCACMLCCVCECVWLGGKGTRWAGQL